MLLALLAISAFGTSASALESAAIRAVSIKALQAKAASAQNKIPQAVANLAGLTEILGYVVDEENKDIILYGTTSKISTNALYTEDFCIALRNNWMKYATLRGNTYEYTDLGCTIDPQPETWDKLSGVSRNLDSEQDAQRIQQQLNQWTQICQSPQRVQVLGMPFNTRFAATVVKADYDMKLLVDGNDSLDIPGFESMTSVKLGLIRKAVQTSQPITAPLASMNRFWFCAGQNRFVVDDGIVWIQECPVILLTEQEQRETGSKRGFGSSGHVDPLARRFAKDFTGLYEKVAEERPIYHELRNLFRFAALAKILHVREMPEKPGLNVDSILKCGLDLSTLLERYPIQEVKVADQVRGRSAIKEFTHETVNGNRTTTYQLWLQSCGGVEMAVEVKPEMFVEPAGSLRRLKKSILRTRPDRDSVSWELPSDADSLVEIGDAAQLTPFNRSRKDRTVVDVQFEGAIYKVSTDRTRIYEGETVSGLATALRASGVLDSPQVAVRTAGISSADLPGFRTALRRQLEKLEPEISVIQVDAHSAEGDIFAAVATPGVALDPPTQISHGSAPEAPAQMLSVKVRGGGRNFNCKVEFVGPKSELAPVLLQKVLDRLGPTGSSSESLLDLLMQTKRGLQKANGMDGRDIQIRIRSENGTIETGAVFRASRSDGAPS